MLISDEELDRLTERLLDQDGKLQVADRSEYGTRFIVDADWITGFMNAAAEAAGALRELRAYREGAARQDGTGLDKNYKQGFKDAARNAEIYAGTLRDSNAEAAVRLFARRLREAAEKPDEH